MEVCPKQRRRGSYNNSSDGAMAGNAEKKRKLAAVAGEGAREGWNRIETRRRRGRCSGSRAGGNVLTQRRRRRKGDGAKDDVLK